jgi:hypothetical protein
MAVKTVPIVLLGLVLAFPSLSVQGASEGLLLWYQTVLPALAPFLILTQLLTVSGGAELLVKPVYPLFHRLFHVSVSGAYILLCGLLCGYPLGAKLCSDYFRQGKISQKEAQYLLAFCCHPSPMFLLGYVRQQLPVSIPPLFLLLSVCLPIPLLSLLAQKLYRPGYGSQNPSSPVCRETASVSLESILLSSAETMVLIGGCMMMFSIFALWIRQISVLPERLQALITGAVEMTTGIHRISTVFPEYTAIPPALAAAVFGGISGIFQTKSVLSDSFCHRTQFPMTAKNAGGLSIRHYVLWKLIHAGLTCIAAQLLISLIQPL